MEKSEFVSVTITTDVDGVRQVTGTHNTAEDYRQHVDDVLEFNLHNIFYIHNIYKFLISFDVYITILGGNKFVTSGIVMPVIKSVQRILTVTPEDPTYIMTTKNVMLDDYKARVISHLLSSQHLIQDSRN